MWSFNRYGELNEAMKSDRNAFFSVDEEKKKREWADMAAAAQPQRGVDALKGAFPQGDGQPPGSRVAENVPSVPGCEPGWHSRCLASQPLGCSVRPARPGCSQLLVQFS